MDYQGHDDKTKCIQTLTQELGFPNFYEENLISAYNFFHQIHLSEKNKSKYKDILTDFSTGFDALTRYTNNTRTQFLEDPLWSRLLYFLFRNFSQTYSDLLNKSIKSTVQKCIDFILAGYDSLKSENETISTESLPI